MNSIGKTYTQAYNFNSTSSVTFGLTTRGYTSHEHLDKVNLINMPACRTLGRNGRPLMAHINVVVCARFQRVQNSQINAPKNKISK